MKDGQEYRPVQTNELSTHIAKLASGNLAHLIEVEYLTTLATRILLLHDEVVELDIKFIPAIKEEALVVVRSDRSATGKRIFHFEEFNQFLGHYSGDDKYEGAYADMAGFMRQSSQSF